MSSEVITKVGGTKGNGSVADQVFVIFPPSINLRVARA